MKWSIVGVIGPLLLVFGLWVIGRSLAPPGSGTLFLPRRWGRLPCVLGYFTFHNLNRFKHVCDGANQTEADIIQWEALARQTGHWTATTSPPWADQMRERLARYGRNPEWRQACQEAWAMTD